MPCATYKTKIFLFYYLWIYCKGECIYVRISTGQYLFIADIKWFVEIVNKIFQAASLPDALDKSSPSNSTVSFVLYDYLRSSTFMDECRIADRQQVDFLLEVLVALNVIIQLEGERNKLIVVENSQNIPKAHSTATNSFMDQLVSLLYFFLDLLFFKNYLSNAYWFYCSCMVSIRTIFSWKWKHI